jgi:hypothetical protein
MDDVISLSTLNSASESSQPDANTLNYYIKNNNNTNNYINNDHKNTKNLSTSNNSFTKFSENFWDEDLTGFNVLFKNLRNSQRNVEELEMLLRECASCEDQYIKNLDKLTSRILKFLDDTIFAPVWSNIVIELNRRNSRSHLHYMNCLYELIREVESYNKDLRKKKAKIKQNEEKTSQTIDSYRIARNQLNRAKENYHQLCLELNVNRKGSLLESSVYLGDQNNNNTLSSQSSNNFFSSLTQRSDKKVQQALDEYKQSIGRYNRARDEYEKRYINSCNAFQIQEEQHLKKMLNLTQNYVQLIDQLNQSRHKGCAEHATKLDSLYTVEQLIQQFIVKRYTGNFIPTPATFVDPLNKSTIISQNNEPNGSKSFFEALSTGNSSEDADVNTSLNYSIPINNLDCKKKPNNNNHVADSSPNNFKTGFNLFGIGKIKQRRDENNNINIIKTPNSISNESVTLRKDKDAQASSFKQNIYEFFDFNKRILANTKKLHTKKSPTQESNNEKTDQSPAINRQNSDQLRNIDPKNRNALMVDSIYLKDASITQVISRRLDENENTPAADIASTNYATHLTPLIRSKPIQIAESTFTKEIENNLKSIDTNNQINSVFSYSSNSFPTNTTNNLNNSLTREVLEHDEIKIYDDQENNLAKNTSNINVENDVLTVKGQIDNDDDQK